MLGEVFYHCVVCIILDCLPSTSTPRHLPDSLHNLFHAPPLLVPTRWTPTKQIESFPTSRIRLRFHSLSRPRRPRFARRPQRLEWPAEQYRSCSRGSGVQAQGWLRGFLAPGVVRGLGSRLRLWWRLSSVVGSAVGLVRVVGGYSALLRRRSEPHRSTRCPLQLGHGHLLGS